VESVGVFPSLFSIYRLEGLLNALRRRLDLQQWTEETCRLGGRRLRTFKTEVSRLDLGEPPNQDPFYCRYTVLYCDTSNLGYLKPPEVWSAAKLIKGSV
jgi:hypothetical protein